MIKNKKLWIAIGIAILAAWVIFRISVIVSENHRVVFNPTRVAMAQGEIVEQIVVNKKTDVLKIAIFVKNNRATVSCNRINKFKVGQQVNGGKIISVSPRIDLDTGMCIIKTTNVADGENFAAQNYTGFFVPVFAVDDGKIMVLENGVAVSRKVNVVDTDSENAVISSGLSDGDIIVISNVQNGDKIK